MNFNCYNSILVKIYLNGPNGPNGPGRDLLHHGMGWPGRKNRPVRTSNLYPKLYATTKKIAEIDFFKYIIREVKFSKGISILFDAFQRFFLFDFLITLRNESISKDTIR